MWRILHVLIQGIRVLHCLLPHSSLLLLKAILWNMLVVMRRQSIVWSGYWSIGTTAWTTSITRCLHHGFRSNACVFCNIIHHLVSNTLHVFDNILTWHVVQRTKSFELILASFFRSSWRILKMHPRMFSTAMHKMQSCLKPSILLFISTAIPPFVHKQRSYWVDSSHPKKPICDILVWRQWHI